MGPRHINIMSTTLIRILLQVVALCLAASLAQGSPLKHPPQSPRQLQPWLEQDANLQATLDLHTKGPDGSCHLFVATEPDALDVDAVLATGGNGITFAVQSNEGDDDGVAVRVLMRCLCVPFLIFDNSLSPCCCISHAHAVFCRSLASDFTWISRRWHSSRR